MTTEIKLINIDPEDICDIIAKIEKSFNIKFGHNELEYIRTFGELCDHIIEKLQLEHSNDCTCQQAFYQLRNAILLLHTIDKKNISTDYALVDILPKQNRRANLKKIEKHLGFKLNILRPPYWITETLTITLFISIIVIFVNWPIGLLAVTLSIAGLWLANKTGKELDLQTMGQVVQKITRENYLKIRRNPKTYNKNEIAKLLTDWFSDDLNLDKSQVTREAQFL